MLKKAPKGAQVEERRVAALPRDHTCVAKTHAPEQKEEKGGEAGEQQKGYPFNTMEPGSDSESGEDGFLMSKPNGEFFVARDEEVLAYFNSLYCKNARQ